jgi:hypothetical protein
MPSSIDFLPTRRQSFSNRPLWSRIVASVIVEDSARARLIATPSTELGTDGTFGLVCIL